MCIRDSQQGVGRPLRLGLADGHAAFLAVADRDRALLQRGADLPGGVGLVVPEPVSYTHLDVYKRQARTTAAPSPGS